MVVYFPRISASRLLWSGDRCWMITNAIPVSVGRKVRNCCRASSPPADDPIPTTQPGFSFCILCLFAIVVPSFPSASARYLPGDKALLLHYFKKPAGLFFRSFRKLFANSAQGTVIRSTRQNSMFLSAGSRPQRADDPGDDLFDLAASLPHNEIRILFIQDGSLLI